MAGFPGLKQENKEAGSMNGPGYLNYLAPGMARRNLLITVGLCTSVQPVVIGLDVKVCPACLN